MRREDRPSGPHIAGLRLIQCTHGGKDPQGLRVEGLAGPLRDAMVVNGGIHRRQQIVVGTGDRRILTVAVIAALAKPQPP